MTEPETKKKISELESWLEESSPEHEARAVIESDLRKLKEKQSRQEYD